MSRVSLTFLGSGDAFGSGGRAETCMLVETPGQRFLMECGASALPGLKKRGVAPSSIGTIVISHFHGDHFSGIPAFILDGQFSKRQDPLTIVGPPGLRERVRAAQELMFPRSSETQQKYPIEFIELGAGVPAQIGPLRVTGYQVVHFCGAPPYAIRVEVEGRTITYSGDTEWTDSLLQAAAGADVFISEAYSIDKKVKFHMDIPSLAEHREALGCKRLILTHMSAAVLARLDELTDFELADDGLVVTV